MRYRIKIYLKEAVKEAFDMATLKELKPCIVVECGENEVYNFLSNIDLNTFSLIIANLN